MSGDREYLDLVARLRVANERMGRLREDAEGADNVIRFRVERHLEAAEEALGDLNVRATDVPAAGSDARRLLERALRRVESEIVFAQARSWKPRGRRRATMCAGSPAPRIERCPRSDPPCRLRSRTITTSVRRDRKGCAGASPSRAA